MGHRAGARAIVEEVSADRHGEVSQIVTVPQNRTSLLNLTQPAQSVFLVSIPKTSADLRPIARRDRRRDGQSRHECQLELRHEPNLFAKNDAVDPAARNVTFIKFNTGSIATSEVEQAVLTSVAAKTTGSASQVIAHVYGLTNDNWNESTITWNNAPNLTDSLEHGRRRHQRELHRRASAARPASSAISPASPRPRRCRST